MKILALETSAKACSAAVVSEDGVLACAFQCSGLTHSRTLMPMVQDMLRNSELTLADMGAIAVAVGPGSFTGIRIGVAAAKGLAWAAELPVAAVSTLEAMAMGLAPWEGLVVCAMDARRSQVYNAVFLSKAGTLARLCDDRAIALVDLTREISLREEPLIVVGDGAALCAAFFKEHGLPCTLAPPHLLHQNATGVGQAAQRLAQGGALVSAQDVEAVYLRPAQAERLRSAQTKKENE